MMTGKQTFWGGTQAEAGNLLKALDRHFACHWVADDARRTSCLSHALLLDQRSMDRLLFARCIADRLRREELLVAA